jgi:hypothetical protein
MPNSSDVSNGPSSQDGYKFLQACKQDAIYRGQFRGHNRDNDPHPWMTSRHKSEQKTSKIFWYLC